MNINIYNNITDLRSERLFREAEDDFYFFRKIKSAQKKLQKALTFSPFYVKALILLANIDFYQGKVQSALNYYNNAQKIDNNNFNILAGLANVNEVLGNNTEALKYIDLALNFKEFSGSSLYNMLIELKVSILINLKKYSEAERLTRNTFNFNLLPEIQVNHVKNLVFLKTKLELQQKIKNRQLKLVK